MRRCIERPQDFRRDSQRYRERRPFVRRTPNVQFGVDQLRLLAQPDQSEMSGPRLTPQIARKVMDQFRRLAESSEYPSNVDGAPAKREYTTETLSEKEERILHLITDGMTNRQIAHIMFLAEGTVKNYVSRIMEKLHANTRTALAVISTKQRRSN
jgi:DNA-binding NarL/FixJ family response regulator